MEIFEKFLWLQAFLVVFGVIYLLKKNRPKGAQFLWRSSQDRVAPREMRRTPERWDPDQPTPPPSRGGRAPSEPPPAAEQEERSLNVHFNYNGHSWDAFEALGLPAGSGPDKVEAAYQRAISQLSENSKEFYDHARNAILNKK